MKEVELKSVIQEYQMQELTAEEQHLIELAIEAMQRSYAPYSILPVSVSNAPPCSPPEHSIPTHPSVCWPSQPEAPTAN